MRAVIPANSPVAATVPSLLYIAPANSGNAAANVNRSALLLDMAEAAMGRYAVTWYVNVEVKTNKMPLPNGTEAMIGTIHGTCAYVVKASQTRPGLNEHRGALQL